MPKQVSAFMKMRSPIIFKLFKVYLSVALTLCSFIAIGQSVSKQAPVSTLAPIFRTSSLRKGITQVRVQVKDKEAFSSWLKQKLPHAQAVSLLQSRNIFLVSQLTDGQLEVLASCPQVQFIDVANRIAHGEMYLQNADFSVNGVEALLMKYPQLNGLGRTVSIKEGAFDTTDIDFKGRVLSNTALNNPVSLHATTMATLVAGAGNTSLNSRGAAWQAKITASSLAELLPDATAELQKQGVTVQNHSYGVGVENYYGLESQAYDEQVLQIPYLLHVFSSGNSGTATDEVGPYAGVKGFANLTGQFKVSKNSLSVGAIDTSGQISSLSSRGPTFDGRIKPEVVAFGEGGTSEAAAIVSGVGTVVQQAYQAQHSEVLPSSALVKAVLINSADEKGKAGPDYEEGFGNVDALGAVETIQQQRYLEGKVQPETTLQFPITVPVGTGRLKVTLVWHDAPADPNTTRALIQDLDLTVSHGTSNQTWLPWVLSSYPHRDSLSSLARRGVDHLNNVEQITIDAPAAGEYRLQVKGYNLPNGEQPFSLVYEFEPVFTWAYPVGGSTLKAGEVNRLRWFALPAQAGNARLEYKWAGETQWRTLANTVQLSKGTLNWHVPDTAAFAQVRMVLADKVIASDEFVIAPQPALQVGYFCENEFMLYWAKIPRVEQYQMYQLGEKYMEPVSLTADTLFIANKGETSAVHYAVAPIIQGKVGARSLTIQYDQQEVACYIKSFLARQFVSDSVLLDVELSTFYGITALFLERKGSNGFEVIKELDPSNLLAMAIADPNPQPGRNEYRIRIVTDQNKTFYSQTEAAFFTPDSYMEVFPNPVKAGDVLQIVIKQSGVTQIEIIDAVGKRIGLYEQDGSVKSISTGNLKLGMYLVRIYTAASEMLLRRVIVL